MPSWLSISYREPIAIERGEGSWVWDAEGARYLDFFGGILSTPCGHSLPEVVEAVRHQAGRLLHASTLYLSEPAIELAELVAEASGIPDAKVFFTTSGTEANDAALLLATSYRRSNQILALRNGYHGRSFSTVSVTGHRSWSPTSFSGLAVSYIHGGYRLRGPFAHLDDAAYTRACVEDLQEVIATTTSGDVACLIAEPIQGVGGVAVPPEGFLAAMADVLEPYGILMVVDEVQTGWGRTGTLWGYEHHGIIPDLMTFAKGVGNGLALGGVVGRADIVDNLTAQSISTFGGNPLAAAGALANLRYLLGNDLAANAARLGERMGQHLDTISDHASVAEVRGRGLMWAIEMVVPGTLEPSPDLAEEIHERTRERGLLIGRGGLYRNVLRIAPPLNATLAEIDEGSAIVVESVGELDHDR